MKLYRYQLAPDRTKDGKLVINVLSVDIYKETVKSYVFVSNVGTNTDGSPATRNIAKSKLDVLGNFDTMWSLKPDAVKDFALKIRDKYEMKAKAIRAELDCAELIVTDVNKASYVCIEKAYSMLINE